MIDAAVVVSDEGLGGVVPFGAALRSMGFEPILLTGKGRPKSVEAWRGTYNHIVETDNLYESDSLKEEVTFLSHDFRIRGLFSCYDGLVVPAARAAAALGLPHPRLSGLDNSRNKYATRLALRENGLANARFCLVESEPDCDRVWEEVGFPAVVKPVNGMASHLVRRVDTQDELRAAYRYMAARIGLSYRGNYSGLLSSCSGGRQQNINPIQAFLVEQFVAGEEYSAEVLVRDGKIIPVALFEKVHLGRGFLETVFAHPISRPDREEALWQYIEAALRALGADQMACHIELIDGADGPILVENNAGRAGGQILVRAVKRFTGIDLITEIVAIATGQLRPEALVPDIAGRVGTLTVFPSQSGKIASILGLDSVASMAGVKEVIPFCKAGDEIDVDDKEFFAVNVLACGLDNKGLLELLQRANEIVKINFELPERLRLPEEAILRDPSRLAAVRTRSQMLDSIRAFFRARSFLEVQTPILHQAPEAAHVHQCETMSVGNRRFYLRTDPEEYLKRYLTAGFDAVFEVASNVRAEFPDDDHLHEFTSIECYRKGWGFDEALSTCIELVMGALKEFRGSHVTLLKGREVRLDLPLQVKTFRDVVFEKTGVDEAFYPDAASLSEAIILRGLWEGEIGAVHGFRRTWLEGLLNEHVLPFLVSPLIITDFPSDLGLSARPRSDDPRYSLRGELYLPGGFELAQIYENLTSPDLLRARYAERVAHRVSTGLSWTPLDDGLLGSAALGMPPMAGFALGIDRLLLLILGCGRVGDGLLFDREGFYAD